jgi:signal transduction histidine kinase
MAIEDAMPAPARRARGSSQLRLLEALQGAHETLGFVLERTSEGVLIVDGQHRVVYANPALATLIPASAKATPKRSFESLFVAGDRGRLRLLLNGWSTEPGRAEVRLDDATDGAPVVLLTGAPLRTESFQGTLVLVTDVSELWLHRRREEILAVVEHGLVEAATLRDGCLHLLRTLGMVFDRPVGGVLLLGGSRDEAGVMHCWHSGSGPSEARASSHQTTAGAGLLAKVVATGRPCRSSLAAEGGSPAAALAEGLAWVEAFPILSERRVVGAVELAGLQPPAADDLLKAVMHSLGRSFGAHVSWRKAVEEDVAERRQAELTLRSALSAKTTAYERMKRMDEIITKALSVVSHEFRTGLFGMQGYSEILSQRELPPATVRKYATSINRDAKRMGRLINDLLDLNRMEAGYEQLQREDVDLRRLIEESVERARGGAGRHTFLIDLAAGLPRVVADPDRLAQVMGNLLANAVKYSPRGGEVTVRAAARADGVQVEIGDQGVGIPANLVEAVFEPFTRSEEHGARTIKGTGLGLSIVRHIVNLHGGRVWAESRIGAGSTFRFTLPLRPPS